MIPAQKSGVIRKAGVPRIPNHFTESNYLDSLPIENVSMVRKGLTKFVGEKKIRSVKKIIFAVIFWANGPRCQIQIFTSFPLSPSLSRSDGYFFSN